jgi:hypothetical protein
MRLLAPSLLLSLMCGCATIRVTDPPRTATEQFLMSQAITQAIQQLNVDSLRDRKVFVETRFFSGAEQFTQDGQVKQRMFTSPEQGFAAAELNERLLQGGARLVNDRKDAEAIVEIRSGGIGIDRLENLIGIPAGVIGNLGGDIPLSTPELAIFKNTRQRGFASVAIVAYRAQTGEYIASSGPYIGRTIRDDWWIMGTGPRTVGNIVPVEQRR